MIQLPPEKIKEIAEQLDCGFQCFINKHTYKIVSIPDTTQFKIDTEMWEAELKELDKNSEKYYKINPMRPSDSFLIMEEFIETLNNKNRLKIQLLESINKTKPFRHSKLVIDNSGEYRQI